MTQKYLIGLNTQEMPGRVVLTFLRVETEIIRADDESFKDRDDFLLLDKQHPIVRQITELFA